MSVSRNDDQIMSGHRGYGHVVAQRAHVKLTFTELFDLVNRSGSCQAG